MPWSCKGILAYAGLQRAAGQEPRCIGYKKLLPPNITITEEDIVPPPPDDAKFIFFGIGVSVYNKEMLSKNRLPLVNGFSQLVISKEYERDEANARQTIDGNDDANDRRHGRRQRQPQQHAAENPGVGVADGGRQGAAVPSTLSRRSSGVAGNGQEGSPSGRDQVEAFMAYAVGRVRKQVEITKQVTEELTKLTPGKLREATVVQAKKVQEMPTLLLDTSKRMVGSGTKFIRNYLNEQERKK